ncbi:hypothetical protein BURPSS13_C0066 [Burkholderia pseudomallei S13]|nr:hypothetical protein BURPSS13_C0066 [Burkholderia pseudomallei S13]
MMPRKRPMPAVIAMRSDFGIPLTITSRTRNSVTSRNRHPEMNTAPSAACHVKPMPLTTVYAK